MTETLHPAMRKLVRECAEKFVDGRYSSADAFARIDLAIRTGWHGNPINETREQFDNDVAALLEKA